MSSYSNSNKYEKKNIYKITRHFISSYQQFLFYFILNGILASTHTLYSKLKVNILLLHFIWNTVMDLALVSMWKESNPLRPHYKHIYIHTCRKRVQIFNISTVSIGNKITQRIFHRRNDLWNIEICMRFPVPSIFTWP